jgi:predicted NAD-dependent protein-ADP-ribosyltransferase YbiA (DUF1768 family)
MGHSTTTKPKTTTPTDEYTRRRALENSAKHDYPRAPQAVRGGITSTGKRRQPPRHCNNRGRSSSPSTNNERSQLKPRSPLPITKQTRPRSTYPAFPNTLITNKHILFWSGPLSNWHIGTSTNKHSRFSGARVLELLLPGLDAARIPHPSPCAISTKILVRHEFNCGEQFMMACKGWLFERDNELESWIDKHEDEHIEQMIEKIVTPRHKLSPADCNNPSLQNFVNANNTILSVLETDNPRSQKALGRLTKHFDEKLWNVASVHVVVSACIARAERDPQLREIYEWATRAIPSTTSNHTGNNANNTTTGEPQTIQDFKQQQQQQARQHSCTRKFVEGSPSDRVWGIGLRWNLPEADDNRNWKGENRLGRCHDEAAKYIREKAFSDEFW